MSNEKITDNSVKIIKSFADIKGLNNINDKAKMFLNSVFNELDTKNKDGVLQDNEGTIYVFDDGAISITKDDNLYAAMTKNGSEVRVVDDCLVTKFADGSESTMKGDKLIKGKTANQREYTVKDGVIIFNDEETKEVSVSKEVATNKSEIKPAETTSKEINGVDMAQLDRIAEEYLEIVRNYNSEEDYTQKIKQKKDLYNKYFNTFKKAINSELKAYNMRDLETDNYIMHFSPVINLNTNKYYWELYDVENKNK